MKHTLLLLAVFLMIFSSCKKKEPLKQDPAFFNPPGVFVVNEGNFTTGNASLTWFGLENDTLMPDVFYTANKVPLGDVANFMAIYKNRGYMVINNSGLVYGIDINDGTFLGKVGGLSSPREILIIDDNHALVSDLFDKYLTVINPASFEITGKIDLHGRTSESMKKIDKKVFVANWSKLNQQKNNNLILVIDIDKMVLVDSIKVTKEPNSMVVDKNGKLWVLCSGGYSNTETPALYRINPVDDLIEAKIEFSDKNSNPFALNINGAKDQLYFLNENIYSMSISVSQIPAQPWADNGSKNFYTLGIRPDKEEVFVSDALDYVRNGSVYIYDQSGGLKHQFEAGIIPGYFCFY